MSSRLVALVALVVAGTTAADREVSASSCAGEPPMWCKVAQPSEPFYNCSGSSSLSAADCAAWQDVYDSLGMRAGEKCAENRNDPCACHSAESIIFCRGGRMRSISISDNRGMNGTLSPSLGNLTSLLFLELSNNALNGPIPGTLSQLKELETLNLGGNKKSSNADGLTGEIPASLGSLPALTYLDLALNKLTGTIPAAIGNLTKLRILYLYDNHLHGKVPALPFKQYEYCGIGTSPKHSGAANEFCTPLPKGALGCKEEGAVRAHACKA